MNRKNFYNLAILIILTSNVCTFNSCQNETLPDSENTDFAESESESTDTSTEIHTFDIVEFLDLKYDEIEAQGYSQSLSYYEGGAFPVYEISNYNGVFLVYKDQPSSEASTDGMGSAIPYQVLISDPEVQISSGLHADMTASEVEALSCKWSDVYMSSENSLYYTTYTDNSYKVTAAWAIPEDMFTEWAGSLGDNDDYYAEFLKFIEPFKSEPVGSIQYLTIEKTSQNAAASNEKFKSESLFTPAKNQKQYKIDDENAEMLATAIEKYLWNDKHIIEDFSDIKEVSDISAFMFTAFASDKVPEIVNLSSVTAEDPENPISVLYNQCAEEGSAPATIYYLDEWQDVIRSLFGEKNPALFEFEDGEIKSNYGGSEASLTIYTEYNAAVSYGTPMFVRGLPQITSYEETDEGYICEAVILHPDGILTLSDGSTVTVTEENFDEYSSYHSKYRYTFTKTDDGLVLSSLETLQDEFV